MRVALLAAGLVLYNNLANLWRPFHGGWYVPVNLAAAAAVLAAGRWWFGLGVRDLGLSARGWEAGALLAIGAGAVLALVLALPRGPERLADRRLAGFAPRTALFYLAVRIPLGTAVLEEVAFRGVLFGALRPWGTAAAIAGSSAAFGLWHIVPTRDLVAVNRPEMPAARVAGLVVAGVLATGAAGALLAWLRARTGGIAAPFALHAGVNVLAAGAALLAHRRLAAVRRFPPA